MGSLSSRPRAAFMASQGPRPKSSSADAWELVTIWHHRAEGAGGGGEAVLMDPPCYRP